MTLCRPTPNVMPINLLLYIHTAEIWQRRPPFLSVAKREICYKIAQC